MNFFKLNRKLHRDLGYLMVGLTIIFCISGIALNHQDDWNPSYDITLEKRVVKKLPLKWEGAELDLFIKSFGLNESYRSQYYPRPGVLKIFLENSSIEVGLKSKEILIERFSERPILRSWVLLHRNKSHLTWTVFSDIYAILLLFLAVGGLFMIKGKNGLRWRGVIFVGFGILISIIFMFF